MCWAYRSAATTIAAANAEISTPHHGRITSAGREASVLIHKGGITQWLAIRYGMQLPAAGRGMQLIWNARSDKLATVETWARLIRQRFAMPVDAYVENAPAETWHTGPTAWMVGFYDTDRDGGAVVITEGEVDGSRRLPVLVGEETAMEWLSATQWNAVPALMRSSRIAFREADLFASKALSADARTRVPLKKAA